MFQFSFYGLFCLTAVLMCWALAVVLFRVSLPGSVARMLALLLVFEGITLGTSGTINLMLGPAITEGATFLAYVANVQPVLHTIGDCAMLALYPVFLSAALRTPIARPFGGRRVRLALMVFSAGLLLVVFLTPVAFGLPLLYVLMAALFTFALIAAVHAWYSAPPGIGRTRAGIFALAFGIRDACWGFIYADGIRWILSGDYLSGEPDPAYFHIIYTGGTFFAVPLIAYGILRTQLFDIDLRIRWTLKQSTVAAMAVSIIYVISELAEQFLSSELGNIAGLLAAAVVIFLLTPLQNFAERVAKAAMPNTERTPEYEAFRKMQVYESAISEAQQEGGISDKERALLVRLRDSLGISESDARAIEEEMGSAERPSI